MSKELARGTILTVMLIFALILGAFRSALADSIIVPDSPVVTGSFIPFGPDFVSGRYQQIYDSSLFPGPIELFSLAFRAERTGSYSANIAIRLAETSVLVGGLSGSNLDSNATQPLVTVFQNIPFLTTATAGAFSIAFDFISNPFFYDPSHAQNLLLDILISDISFTCTEPGCVGSTFSVSRVGFTGLTARAFASSAPLPGGSSGADGVGLLTRIDFVPATVPEPSTLLLLGSGLAGLGGIAWRRHRRG